jgi:DNA-binding CsgD family transcriptional regulator
LGGGSPRAAVRVLISVNTVKKHLTHVYARVDVDGRADLAGQVARRDL